MIRLLSLLIVLVVPSSLVPRAPTGSAAENRRAVGPVSPPVVVARPAATVRASPPSDAAQPARSLAREPVPELMSVPHVEGPAAPEERGRTSAEATQGGVAIR